MKENILKCKEWWNALAARERQLISIGGVIVSIFILYYAIWQPLNNHVDSMRETINQNAKLLQWMKATDLAIQKHEKQTTKKTEAVSPVAMLGVLQKRIEKNGLASSLKQLKQATSDSIEMHFEKVNFDKLMKLIITISKEDNLTLDQFSVVAQSDDGTVNADIILK